MITRTEAEQIIKALCGGAVPKAGDTLVFNGRQFEYMPNEIEGLFRRDGELWYRGSEGTETKIADA